VSQTSSPRIRIKFVNRGLSAANALIWQRQFPQRIPVWGNCEFIFDRFERRYDWLVVDNDLPAQQGEDQRTAIETLACPPEHTLFITREPSSIATYGTDFLNQFGHVLTGQEDWAIRHRHKIHSQPALRWYYGDTSRSGFKDLRDYDYFVAHPPTDKTRVISTVCSAKRQKHTLHHARVMFIERLCARLPELERFGEGVREMSDKAEAMDAYQYHIAIENHICDHWWTEKLSDSFLALTLPFYSGAPNAVEYFPAESFIPIDLGDFEGSLQKIRSAIENNEYEKRLPAIREARRLVLEKYNLVAVVAKIVEERHNPAARPQPGYVIRGRIALRKNPVVALRIAYEKTVMRLRAILQNRRHL
jgi:hypothetical protein